MPRIRLALVCLGLCLLAPAGAMAASAPPDCPGQDNFAALRAHLPLLGRLVDGLVAWQVGFVPNGGGVLWKIEGKNGPPSYLLGTLHLTDQRLIDRLPQLDPYLGPDKVLATELGETMIGTEKYVLAGKLALRAMVPKGDSLSSIADPDDRRAVESLFAARGLPPAAVGRMAPWLLAISVSLPVCEQKRQQLGLPVFDVAITERAKRAGMRIAALETAEEQLAVLAAIPTDLSAQVLIAVARGRISVDDAIATLTGLYLDGRVGILLNRPAAWLLFGRFGDPEFTRMMLGNRNQVMRERARPLLERGNALIAVGALHLPGEDGLVALLRKDGYTLTRVW